MSGIYLISSLSLLPRQLAQRQEPVLPGGQFVGKNDKCYLKELFPLLPTNHAI